MQDHGVRPAQYLDRLGRWLDAADGVWLDESELALVADRGATLVTNPVANMKLAVGGILRYRTARGHGIPVGGLEPTAPGPTTRWTCSRTLRSWRSCKSTTRAIRRSCRRRRRGG